MYPVKFLKLFQPYKCDNLIRLGKSYDGGYLINSADVAKTHKFLSFGIGSDTSFEEDFLQINDCGVDAYDASAKTSDFFDSNTRTLHLKNVANVNNTVHVAIQDILIENNTFIKCDIEGGEYRLFDHLIEKSHNLSGLVIEVHSINDPDNFNNLLNFISKIRLRLVHIHVNNYFYYKTDNGNIPDILELSFSSSDNVRYDTTTQLPNVLDMVNNPNDEEFQIYF